MDLSELIQFLENINDILNQYYLDTNTNYEPRLRICNSSMVIPWNFIPITDDVKSSINSYLHLLKDYDGVMISILFGEYKFNKEVIDNVFNRLNNEYPNVFKIDGTQGYRFVNIFSVPIKIVKSV
jgi:hypothetical protein